MGATRANRRWGPGRPADAGPVGGGRPGRTCMPFWTTRMCSVSQTGRARPSARCELPSSDTLTLTSTSVRLAPGTQRGLNRPVYANCCRPRRGMRRCGSGTHKASKSLARRWLRSHARLLDKLPGLPDCWLLLLMCAAHRSNYSSQVSTESRRVCANFWAAKDPFRQPGFLGGYAAHAPRVWWPRC